MGQGASVMSNELTPYFKVLILTFVSGQRVSTAPHLTPCMLHLIVTYN